MNQHDTKKWQDWAEKTVAAMSRSAAARGHGRDAVALQQVDPLERPLGCPACGGKDVQVAALMFTMPDSRLAYADGDGLQVFNTLPVDALQNGVTLVFRCEDGHMFFRHWGQNGTGTRVTGLAVNVSQEALADERPLWSLVSGQAKEGGQ